jgi:threonine/homoserine/homoserine lactone efflux protein
MKIFLSKPMHYGSGTIEGSNSSSYFSSLFLTITNPMTILSFVAAFAGLGLGNSAGDYFSATAMVSGVFLGSATWWLILSGVSGKFRSRVSPATMIWINRISGGLYAH